MKESSKAFTLIELSIVITIIALLAGAIIGGQAVVRAAQLRSVTKDVNLYINASKAFRDKYGYLPGDMPNATSFWGKDTVNCNADPQAAGTPGTCNGDGDNYVRGTGAGNPPESFRLWQHMALSGLIPGSFSGVAGGGGVDQHVIGTNAPASKVQGAGFSFYYAGTFSGNANFYDGIFGHILMFGAGTATSYTQGPIISQGDALSIDLKMDDGLPGMGAVQAFKSSSAITPNCTTTAVNSTAAYNNAAASKDTPLCNLIFITGF